MWLTIILLAILFGSLAMMLSGGLWSNALIFINVVTAALLSVNYFEPLAAWLSKQGSYFHYAGDFAAQWIVFVLAMIVFRTLTDLLSKVKVRFKKPVNLGGAVFFALWTGWVMACFTTWTLHTAPLARNHLRGAFQPTPESRMFLGLAPDRLWLGFSQKLSRGAYSRSGTAENPQLHEFDPAADYIFRYGERRKQFEKVR